MSEAESKSRRKNRWLWIGGGLTVLVVGLGIWTAQSEICAWGGITPAGCISRWEYFLNSPPNEIGDTLAGFAGALAFVWLVVAVLLQSQELSEQREEFEKMADAQAEQVKLMESQAKIFADEQRQRDEARASTKLERLLERVVFALRGLTIKADLAEHGGSSSPKKYPLPKCEIIIATDIGFDDGAIREISEKVQRFNADLGAAAKPNAMIRKLSKRQVFENAERDVGDVLELVGLSEADEARLENMKLSELRDNIRELLERNVWAADEELGINETFN